MPNPTVHVREQSIAAIPISLASIHRCCGAPECGASRTGQALETPSDPFHSRSSPMKTRIATLLALSTAGAAHALSPTQIDTDRANGTLKEVVLHGASELSNLVAGY